MIDRRTDPRSGYRGVHVIVQHDGRNIEIQVRTRLQNAWAQYSEKLADQYGNDVKYGGGPDEARARLDAHSEYVAAVEELELEMDDFKGTINPLLAKHRAGRASPVELEVVKKYKRLQAQKRKLRKLGFRKLEVTP